MEATPYDPDDGDFDAAVSVEAVGELSDFPEGEGGLLLGAEGEIEVLVDIMG